MVRRTRLRPHRRPTGHPQAIRRRPARRFPRYQLLDALVLVLVALGLFYLANPVGASELPAEVPVESNDTARGDLLEAAETGTASASVEPQLETSKSAAGRPTTAAPAAGAPRSTLPSARPTLYELAAARYELSPRLLRALHLVESDGAADGCLTNLEGSGATGPFQFKPATFHAYAIDADGDGRPNICGFADSLFSAARYLKALGADGELSSPGTLRALRRYGTDPELVVRLAS